jgi:hypothetical protein
MFRQQIAELELRKKALLLESAQNRLRLRTDFQNLRSRTTLLESLAGVGFKLGPWAMTLGTVAGLLGAAGLRRAAGSTGILGKTLSVLPVAIRLWRAFRTRREEPDSTSA